MKKRVIAMLMSGMLSIGTAIAGFGSAPMQVLADDIKEEDPDAIIWDGTYTILDDGTIRLDKYLGKDTEVTIPTELTIDGQEYKVTQVGACFQGNKNICKIIIPDGIVFSSDRYGWNFFFGGCSNLTAVSLPSDLEGFKFPGLRDTSSLRSFILPKSVKNMGTDEGLNKKIICGYPGSIATNLGKAFIDISTAKYHDAAHLISRGNDGNYYLVDRQFGVDFLNGIEQVGGEFYVFKDGIWQEDISEFTTYNGCLFRVTYGSIDKKANGLVNDPVNTMDWYYCNQGQVVDYTGLVEYDGAWFYVNKGLMDTTMKGYVSYDSGLFYVAAGRILREVNGLAQDPNTSEWYYCANGEAQLQYTGLATYDGEWFYIVNGKLAETYNGYVWYDGSQFLVENGMVK